MNKSKDWDGPNLIHTNFISVNNEPEVLIIPKGFGDIDTIKQKFNITEMSKNNKTSSLDEVKDKLIGEKDTEARKAYESELDSELVGEISLGAKVDHESVPDTLIVSKEPFINGSTYGIVPTYDYINVDPIQSVYEFHKTFNHPVLDKPQIPAKERCELRVKLIQEELDELKEAIENKDLVEVADAFADIQYVLAGAILEFGLGSKFNQIFAEVQRSNMSKACSFEGEAQATVDKEKARDVIAHYEKVGKYFIVYRSEDNKILKSIEYSPADIKSILK